MFHFYNPWKYQKIEGFLIFSGGIKSNIGWEWVNEYGCFSYEKKWVIWKEPVVVLR